MASNSRASTAISSSPLHAELRASSRRGRCASTPSIRVRTGRSVRAATAPWRRRPTPIASTRERDDGEARAPLALLGARRTRSRMRLSSAARSDADLPADGRLQLRAARRGAARRCSAVRAPPSGREHARSGARS